MIRTDLLSESDVEVRDQVGLMLLRMFAAILSGCEVLERALNRDGIVDVGAALYIRKYGLGVHVMLKYL